MKTASQSGLHLDVAFTVSLLVKDCQNPLDPLQPGSQKKNLYFLVLFAKSVCA